MEFGSASAQKSLREKMRAFLTTSPCPGAVFSLSSAAWSGIVVAAREKKIRQHSVSVLSPGLIEPHFDKKNIRDRSALIGIIKRDLARLHYSGEKAACLLPEPCLKVFVFSFESLPLAEKEKNQLFLWRVKKQVPLLAEDVRLAYQVMNGQGTVKVLVCVARVTLLEEYEEVLAAAGIKVGVITTPTLSLLNLVDWEKEKDFLLVHAETNSTSLVAVNDSRVSLFRVKRNPVEEGLFSSEGSKVEAIMTEIENTIHFLEDREQRKLSSLWLHASSAEFQALLQPELRERLPFPVKPFDLPFPSGLSPSERARLVPLWGQIL